MVMPMSNEIATHIPSEVLHLVRLLMLGQVSGLPEALAATRLFAQIRSLALGNYHDLQFFRTAVRTESKQNTH